MPHISQPIPYTASPFWLAVADLWLFIRVTLAWPPTAGLPSIVLPLYPFRCGKLAELYPCPGNLWALSLHLILIVIQSIFVLLWIPSAFIGVPFLYTPAYLASIVGFIFANKWCCRLLNGWGRHYKSNVDLSAFPAHDDEKWIFINGVAAGKQWMQSNLDRLALGFRRPVEGIHNETRGIIFDVFECIIQRTFNYATPDIREAYATLVEAISNEKYRKIIVILHSQGAIEGGLALDWMFATIPGAHLSRVEVYTFGSAANHFNSPPACKVNEHGHILQDDHDHKIVNHIEHYANSGDYVSRFGILHFRPMPRYRREFVSQRQQENVENRYVGTLFVRKASGHQMNANYLDEFFTMDDNLTATKDSNLFMDSEVNEELLDQFEIASIKDDSAMWDSSRYKPQEKSKTVRRIKDVSRLWKYRNGQSPAD